MNGAVCRLVRAWQPAAIIVTASVALLAAACGGSPNGHVAQAASTTTQASPPSGGSVLGQAVAYANCMRNHGVPSWPDPNSRGVFNKSAITPQKLGFTSVQIAAAQMACRHLQPHYASAGPTSAEVQRIRAQALRFAQCMRNRGITDFPDPDSRGGIRIPHSIENSPQYSAALNACKPFPPPPYPPG